MNSKIGIIILVYFVVLYVMCIYYDYQCLQLEEQVTTVQDELLIAKNDLQLATEDYAELNKTLENTRDQLKKHKTIVNDLKDIQYKLIYLGEFKLTHYCIEASEHICGTGTGITATGTRVTAGRTIAVDPSVMPYGTEVYIEGYGWRIAEDCGGAVNGNHIDIAVSTHSRALSMGTAIGGVWILVQ